VKKSRFTDSQIMAALKRVEAGLPVPEMCRELGISTATFYKWRAKFGGMDTSMMTRMKELEDPLCQTSCRLLRNQEPGGGDEGIKWHVTDNHSRTKL
jgi:putative transposase